MHIKLFPKGKTLVSLFGLILYVPVNRYGHVGMVYQNTCLSKIRSKLVLQNQDLSFFKNNNNTVGPDQLAYDEAI